MGFLREGLGRILSKEGGEGSFTEGWGGLLGDESECFSIYLTSIHIFPAIIRKKQIYAKEVPPFHPRCVICLRVSVLDVVELWVEYGWNFT